MKLSVALALNLDIAPNNQLALLADQKTRMASLGEVDFIVSLGSVQMRVRALIMKNLQAQCFGGTTFHADNDIETRIKSGTVKIHGRFLVDQSNPYDVKHTFPPPIEQIPSNDPSDSSCPHSYSPETPVRSNSNLCNINAISLPNDAVTFPMDYLKIPIPAIASSSGYVSISPSFPVAYGNDQWNIRGTAKTCFVTGGRAHTEYLQLLELRQGIKKRQGSPF